MNDRQTRRDRGAVIPIVALCLGVLVLMTAFTIDIGRQILRRRDMQAIADVVSLDMARLVNGRTRSEILTSITPSWTTELSLSAQRNDFSASGLAYKLGNVVNHAFVEDTVATNRPTAVQITASDTIDFYFAPGTGGVTRTAVAELGGSACFSIGSFAAALNASPGSLLPTFLNSALGASVVSYNGLANVQVNLRQLATRLGFGSPSDLFNATVSRRDVYFATANLLDQSGNTAEATVLRSIGTSTNSNSTVQFGDIITVEQGSEEAALDTAFNVLDIVAGSAFLANGTNSLSVPNLGLTVPGLTSASASVKVIEGPQLGCRHLNGNAIGTSQVEVTLNMTISLGPFSVATVTVKMTMASAEGTLVNPLSCGPPALMNVRVDGTLATTEIRQTIGIVTTTVAPGTPAPFQNFVGFTFPPDLFNVAKSSASGQVGMSSANVTTLAPGVQLVLNASLPLVDSLINRPFAQRLGLKVAGADVTPIQVTCNEVGLAL